MKFSAEVNIMKTATGSMKGFATLIIDDLVKINGFRIIEGSKGLFVAVPQTKGSKPGEDGKDQYFDDIKFTDADEKGISATKAVIQKTILEAYEALAGTANRKEAATARTKDPTPTNKRPGMARSPSW